MPLDELEVAKILADAEDHKGPINETYVGMMSLILGGWIDVSSNPGVFTKTAYHCLRRLPGTNLMNTLITNWMEGQRAVNRLLAALCLRYAIAKIGYDAKKEMKDFYTSKICPLRIAYNRGWIARSPSYYKDLGSLEFMTSDEMWRVNEDLVIECERYENSISSIPPFGSTW